MNERQSVRMSKITNDGLTRSGTVLYRPMHQYGNSGRQRVKPLTYAGLKCKRDVAETLVTDKSQSIAATIA